MVPDYFKVLTVADPIAYQGNSGISGLPGIVCRLQPGLVRVVDEQKPRGRGVKPFVLVTPFCGKVPELEYYLRSLDRIPTEQCHAVFYDNSCNGEFQNRLRNCLRERFTSWCLVEDRNPPQFFVSHNTCDPSAMWPITQRIADIYALLYENFVPRASKLVLNLEDDIEIPAGGIERLLSSMDTNPELGTIIGTCCDRRPNYDAKGKPIAFDFQVEGTVSQQTPTSVKLIHIREKTFGVEPIGAGHTGCWLTRTSALESCPIGEATLHGIKGHDLVWGWRLHEAGLLCANDWSVKCRHWYHDGLRMASV